MPTSIAWVGSSQGASRSSARRGRRLDAVGRQASARDERLHCPPKMRRGVLRARRGSLGFTERDDDVRTRAPSDVEKMFDEAPVDIMRGLPVDDPDRLHGHIEPSKRCENARVKRQELRPLVRTPFWKDDHILTCEQSTTHCSHGSHAAHGIVSIDEDRLRVAGESPEQGPSLDIVTTDDRTPEERKQDGDIERGLMVRDDQPRAFSVALGAEGLHLDAENPKPIANRPLSVESNQARTRP